MNDKQVLLNNIHKLHTTKLGIDRIQKNLELDSDNIVDYIESLILNENCNIYTKKVRIYCEVNNIKICINSSSYTIITAHKN
ncbi:DUF3781 domain-containing protein [Methanosphaera cuniculi]|uniref:DUF3781 domain-containing protein n=1 Tax=Methanosphaera cuniculi TaxID=1077256 RepID=UPI0026EF1035|nr:DUF3781 domain-containing protein [Methanosphaera cuniculi]